MNNWLEQFMDRRLGVVLCFFLTLLEKARLLLIPGARRIPPVRRILFVKPVEQGALVLAYGAIKDAVDRVGRDNVFVFAFAKNREILDILNVIPRDNVITARDDSPVTLALDMVRAILRMHRLRIDTAIDLEIFARVSIIICWLSGARRRVGLHRFNSEGPYRGALVTHRVQYNPYLHTAQAFDIFVRSAFAEDITPPLLKEAPLSPLCPPPAFVPDDADLEAVNRALAGFLPPLPRCDDAPWPLVILNPKCVDELPARKWADACFVGVGREMLRSHPEARILITGLPYEQEACESMVKAIDPARCINLAGKLSLRGLITLMTLTDALVSSDSGPAHFAAMTDIGGVVLFGPETPLLYSPLTDRLHVVYLRLACSPCFSPMNYRLSPCTDNQCMQRITVEQVHRELCTVLEKQKAE
ncbi:MAG: glycosyltransferase family 9 protein [Candidatus Hydrogenedentes bacterium]|nr:glycosyltransferase family 9 protein [Candidatus Hydrogenedentota bacterium]